MSTQPLPRGITGTLIHGVTGQELEDGPIEGTTYELLGVVRDPVGEHASLLVDGRWLYHTWDLRLLDLRCLICDRAVDNITGHSVTVCGRVRHPDCYLLTADGRGVGCDCPVCQP